MKKMALYMIIFAILLSLCFPTYAVNTDCSHNYSWDTGQDTDICNKCGYVRIHKCTYTLTFVTTEDNIPVRTRPDGNSKQTRSITKAGTKVGVIGRVRNQRSDLWVLTDENDYIFIDYLAFDFDTMVEQACASSVMCYEDYDLSSMILHVDFTSKLLDFFFFSTGKNGDLKQDGLLGNKQAYKVFVNSKIVTEQYRGSDIGNSLYGFILASQGYSLEMAVRLGGIAVGDTDTISACLVDESFCDDAEDIVSIARGYNYNKTGKWTISPVIIENASSPNVLNEKDTWVVNGNIKSTTPLDYVQVFIYTAEDNGFHSYRYQADLAGAYQYDIHNMDDIVTINELPPNSYEYSIIAHTMSGEEYILYTSPFIVRAENHNVTITNYNLVHPLQENSVFSIYGKIASRVGLTEVCVEILTSEGRDVCDPIRGYPQGETEYNISSLDHLVEFQKLPAGSYYYVITASTDSSIEVLVNQAFFVY